MRSKACNASFSGTTHRCIIRMLTNRSKTSRNPAENRGALLATAIPSHQSRASRIARAVSFRSEPASEDCDEAQRARQHQPEGQMSEVTTIAGHRLTVAQPAPPAKPVATIERAGQIRGRLKTAIDAMVWLGLTRKLAAEHAGMTEHGLYTALRKPHVKAFYLSECEVLRTSGRARRIHRLEAMLEQDDNKAAVINAALALDRVTDQEVAGKSAALPGLQIIIQQTVSAPVVSGPSPIDVTHD